MHAYLEAFGPGMPSVIVRAHLPGGPRVVTQTPLAMYSGDFSRCPQSCLVRREHQQDESLVALRCLCLAEDSEYQEVHFTWPGQRRNFYAKYTYTIFCSDGRINDVRASCRDFVKESMGDTGLQVYVNRPKRCDELSSWRSINFKFDSCGKSLLCATVWLGQECMQGRRYQNWRYGTTRADSSTH